MISIVSKEVLTCWKGHYIPRESYTTRNVYWSRASVCVSICLSAAACPHYCTDPGVTLGMLGVTLVVHYWADLQSVHGLRCYNNIAPRVLAIGAHDRHWQHRSEREMSASTCMYSLNAWFWISKLYFAIKIKLSNLLRLCIVICINELDVVTSRQRILTKGRIAGRFVCGKF